MRRRDVSPQECKESDMATKLMNHPGPFTYGQLVDMRNDHRRILAARFTPDREPARQDHLDALADIEGQMRSHKGPFNRTELEHRRGERLAELARIPIRLGELGNRREVFDEDPDIRAKQWARNAEIDAVKAAGTQLRDEIAVIGAELAKLTA
jgi:hypothetical protein